MNSEGIWEEGNGQSMWFGHHSPQARFYLFIATLVFCFLIGLLITWSSLQRNQSENTRIANYNACVATGHAEMCKK